MKLRSVDILLAVYNGEAYLDQQLLSIEGQTYMDWNLIISDDGSNDSSPLIIGRWLDRDPRIAMLENGGKQGNALRNFAQLINASTADYFMPCDQDDYWLEDKVEVTLCRMKELERQYGVETPLLVFTDMAVVDGNLELLNASFEVMSHIDPTRIKLRQVLVQSLGAGCTMMGNAALRELFKKQMTLDGVIMHDWWLTLIAAAFGHIGHVDRATSLYRQHDRNAIGAVEYSPLRRFFDSESMYSGVRKTVLQAQRFLDAYGDILPDRERGVIANYVELIDIKSPLLRTVQLVKGGYWKKGLRKVGQLMSMRAL